MSMKVDTFSVLKMLMLISISISISVSISILISISISILILIFIFIFVTFRQPLQSGKKRMKMSGKCIEKADLC